MFVLVHGASDAFWADVERRFVGATMSRNRERMLRFDQRVDTDEAWARARELLAFGIERGVFDLLVHVVSTWDERERPGGLPFGFVFLSDSVGRTLLSREANGRRVPARRGRPTRVRYEAEEHRLRARRLAPAADR
jgi:hypothetical protein